MNSQQLQAIREYLNKQGMTFEPLQDEMLDHISCDIEGLMQNGSSFEDAWQKVLHEIPPKQLHTIQIETMETINKKETLSKWFAYLSFVLLFAGSAFKLLKLPGAGQLVIASLAAIVVALFSGSISGVYWNREKKGGWLLLGIILSISLFLASFTFQILHLPGATELRTISVAGLCVLYSVSFININNENSILPFLHQRYTPAIERFIMILFGVIFLIRVPVLLTGSRDVVSQILLVVVIAAAGLQLFSLMWHSKQRFHWLVVVGLITSVLFFLLPAMVELLPFSMRAFMGAPGFFASAGIIIIVTQRKDRLRITTVVSIAFIVVLNAMWAFSATGVVSGTERFLFNALVLIALVLCLYPQRKNSEMKMYVTAAIAHYLFVYPWEIGLW